MVQKGDILYNPISRATFTLILTSADTEGQLLQMDITIAPGGNLCDLPMHVHPKQSEILTIKTGKVWATVNGEKKLYGPGDKIIVPAGAPHTWENASKQEELNFLCEVAPALNTETIYETILALSHSGGLNTDGSVPLFQYALTLNRHKNHFYHSTYPIWLQKVLFCLLSPVSLLMGYKVVVDYKRTLSMTNSSTLLYS